MGHAVLVIRWILIAVVLIVAVIGFLHITRGTAVKHVRGNRVELALDGDGTFPRL